MIDFHIWNHSKVCILNYSSQYNDPQHLRINFDEYVLITMAVTFNYDLQFENNSWLFSRSAIWKKIFQKVRRIYICTNLLLLRMQKSNHV